MSRGFHCTALAAVGWLAAAGAAVAQTAQPAQPAPGDAAFSVFVRGTQVGREQATLSRGSSGWIITSTGRSAAPIDFTTNRFDMKYTPDWQPLEMTLEARAGNTGFLVRTSFTMTTAINEVTQNNTTASKNDPTSPRTIVAPGNVFASYEALAIRLWNAAAGSELPVYVAPQAEVKVKVAAVSPLNLTGPAGEMRTRKFDVVFQYPDRPRNAVVVVDERVRLVRFEIPDIGLLVVRDDVSSVAVRAETTRNPTDAEFTIPANGFNLAGTLTTPPKVAGRLKYPGVVLIGGNSPGDRDQAIDGVPIFAQLARGLADAGHVVLRYDRRGTGQSGGRTDTVTLADYADDAIAAVKWLSKRDDVDKRRMLVVGHLDGGPVALIAASRGGEIDGVATIDAAGASGADLILLQQQKVLTEMKLTPEDRQTRIDLQTKIQAAVISGKGWEGVPPAMRRQADTPWFKSVLTYEPAQVMTKVKQPVLVIHGDLDANVPASEADRLVGLAKARKNAPASEVVHIPDVGHTLAPPGGNVITPKASTAIADFIKKAVGT